MEDYEVSTDGRTVWVNAPICIGRFCPSSGEVMHNSRTVYYIIPANWDRWVARMQEVHGVYIDDSSIPGWCDGG